MVKRYRLLLCFYDYLNTKYACWIRDPVNVEEIENTPFLFSMYPFHKNTHYTKTPPNKQTKTVTPLTIFLKIFKSLQTVSLFTPEKAGTESTDKYGTIWGQEKKSCVALIDRPISKK